MSWSWKSAANGITPHHHLPPGWKVARVGDLATLVNGQPYDSKFFGQEGAPLIRIRDILGGAIGTRYSGDPLTSRRVRHGDLLIGMDGDFNVGRWEHAEPGLLNQRVLALEAPSDISSWLGYCLPEPLTIINDLTYSTTVKHLSAKAVASIRIPVPDEKNLAKLLDYLDHETAEIDTLIREQEELLELLAERSVSTVETVITHGLTGEQLVPSGLAWPYLIPKSWTLQRTSWLFDSIGSGTTPSSRDSPAFEGDIPWVTTGELRERGVKNTERRVSEAAMLQYSSLQLHPVGSLMIAMYGATIGRLGWLEVDATVNQAVCVFSGYQAGPMKFAFYGLLAARRHIQTLASGGGQPNINQEKLRALRLPVPPVDVQESIVEMLDKFHETTAQMERDATALIKLAKERRAALISAAVTGQIDVTQQRKPVAAVLEDEVGVKV